MKVRAIRFRRCYLFDFRRAEFIVAPEDDVDLLRAAVTVKVEIWLMSRVLVSRHQFRHYKVLQKRPVHRIACDNLRRRPPREIANKTSIVEVKPWRLDRTLEHIVRARAKPEDDPRRLQHIDSSFGGLDVDIRILDRSRLLSPICSAECLTRCRANGICLS